MRRAAPALVALAFALALAGCETTAEKSARLETQARRHSVVLARSGLAIARTSTSVHVIGTGVLRSSEGAVAIVELRNTSSHAEASVPIAVTVTDAHGGTLYRNNAAGLEAALASVPSLPAHATLTWVDDQIPPSANATAVSARVGEVPAVSAGIPQMRVAGLHLIEDPSNGVGAAGTVSNPSRVAQGKLVIFGVARRGGRIVAAGRAVLPELAVGAQLPFQIFFVGDPRGARLEASAPASTIR